MKILQGIGDLLDRICGFLIVIIIVAVRNLKFERHEIKEERA